MKLKLSEINQVKISALKPNDRNKHYFKPEAGAYFTRLLEDIKKRGITVPLVAKPDGTLLAGHNRLIAAKAAGLKEVPVQYVAQKLTEAAEIEYIIKDNLLRRHLSIEERKALYRRLFKDFDERVMIKKAPGISLDVKEIAEQTGLDGRTISYDLTMIRRNAEKKAKESSDVDILNEKAIDNYKKAISRMLNTAIIEKGRTIEQFKQITQKAAERLEHLSQVDESTPSRRLK